MSNAVIWVRRNGVKLRILNSGHNYEGYSNGNCVLVIDVSEMTGIAFDAWSNTVQVQGGVTNTSNYISANE
ncbi:MAG: FAD-dependent oxidoreductase [Clostridiales bacterium]|nr:FAD-dependent oxidoreductase [Clostridiales bacterium]